MRRLRKCNRCWVNVRRDPWNKCLFWIITSFFNQHGEWYSFWEKSKRTEWDWGLCVLVWRLFGMDIWTWSKDRLPSNFRFLSKIQIFPGSYLLIKSTDSYRITFKQVRKDPSFIRKRQFPPKKHHPLPIKLKKRRNKNPSYLATLQRSFSCISLSFKRSNFDLKDSVSPPNLTISLKRVSICSNRKWRSDSA
jgi:hypothetical protein